MTPEVSVIVPTRGRREKLRACLGGLAAQAALSTGAGGAAEAPARFEVIVSVDGPDAGESAEADRARAAGVDAQVISGAQSGPAAARNRALSIARGAVVLLLNDDVIPAPGLLASHCAAHRELGRRGEGALILGAAPWVQHEPDRVLDRLVRETSLVFFYDQMQGRAQARDRDWGFRHAWTLNLSAPRAWMAECGFHERFGRAVYEDLEWAWRLRERFGARVLHRPEAIVRHDHRYEADDLLRRQVLLGAESVTLARISPRCAQEVFGADLLGGEESGYSAAFVAREEGRARRSLATFRALAESPSGVLDGPGEVLVQAALEQSLLLRRFLWRLGHTGALAGQPVERAWAWLNQPAAAPISARDTTRPTPEAIARPRAEGAAA